MACLGMFVQSSLICVTVPTALWMLARFPVGELTVPTVRPSAVPYSPSLNPFRLYSPKLHLTWHSGRSPRLPPPVRLDNYPQNEKQENAITQTGDNEIKL